MAIENFYYNEQIKSYLVQFMAIFSGLQVQLGKRDNNAPQLISVPIHYGNMDRVVAAIASENTQNKPIRLPMLSTYLTGIDLDPTIRKGVGTKRSTAYTPRGGLFPDDVKNVEQLMPVPYKARTEVSIYASNTDQMNQILEQILMLFDPMVQIQTSDGALDWTKITTVTLETINNENNYPSATDKRMIVWTLGFSFTIYISAPADLKSNIIKKINVRIGVINGTIDPSTVTDILDGENLDYETWFDLEDVSV